MLEEYQPNEMANYNPHQQELKWANISQYGTTNSIAAATGEGMLMAKEAGANLYQMDLIQLLPGSTTAPNSGGLTNTMYVNELGNRIVNETGRRDELALAYIAQEKRGGSSWAVTGIENRTGGTPTGTPYADVNALGTAILTAAKGRAPTLDELNAFVTNFNAAVQDYNDHFDAGTADWAGKRVKDYKLGPPWYYARNGRPNVHHSMGGIEINANTEVLNPEGQVIPGLYAAGECVGGLHGGNRIGGNAVGDIIVFGRIAGEKAAAYASTLP
jgi:succinate dehydrogenase/fumarate reductase flavoprotein subunit